MIIKAWGGDLSLDTTSMKFIDVVSNIYIIYNEIFYLSS